MIHTVQEYLKPTTDSDVVKRKLGQSLSRENVAAKELLSARVEGSIGSEAWPVPIRIGTSVGCFGTPSEH